MGWESPALTRRQPGTANLWGDYAPHKVISPGSEILLRETGEDLNRRGDRSRHGAA